MLPPENIIKGLVAPELLGKPVYLIDAREAADLCGRQFVTAWTGPQADLIFQQHLQAAGRWAGRGLAIALEANYYDLWPEEKAAVLCHEAAHWATFGADRDATFVQAEADRTRDQYLLASPAADRFVSKSSATPTPRRSRVDDGAHDLQFAVVAYHAAHRWAQVGVKPDPKWLLAGTGIGFAVLEPYLALEANERLAEPLTAIARSPLPHGLAEAVR